MPRLLVIHHSPTPSVQQLTDAVLAGAADDALDGVDVQAVGALDATAADVLAADAVLLGTSANFGYMSGALKHFFDRSFLDLGGALDQSGSGAPASGGRIPYGLYVHGRYDTTGAVRSIQAIVGALPWRQGAPVLEVLGDVDDASRRAGYELGATIAALTL